MSDSLPFEESLDASRAVAAGRHFDVFLSHNSRDKPFVERIAERLKRARLEPWLDSWQLVPGADWQRGLAEGLAASRCCAVFVGPSDSGAWQNQEVGVALDRAAADSEFRVFLVLLPGLPERFDAAGLTPFLGLRTWVDFRSGLADERAFQTLVGAIKGVPLGPVVPIEPEIAVCPYRGLEAFEEEHAAFFFGREADVQRLLEKLKGTRFLAVLGASGSGKSSLVRAGLVPALKQDALSGEESWEVAVMRPGAHPLEALAAQVLRLGADVSMQQTLDALATDQRTLHLAGSLALSERPAGARLLLVIDQFEEVFTLGRDEQERSAFFANLLYAATVPGGSCSILLAIRADFYHRCAAYPELAQRLAAEQYLVSPLQPDGLRQAVEEPARRVGLSFESGLVATIIEDVADQPGALPLLEHALLEVWRLRAGGMLTLAGYRESGGVQGAIAKRAEHVFASLDREQQEVARRTFLRLTQPGEGTEDTRRRAQLIELAVGKTDGEIGPVLSRLVDARLVTTSRDETSGGDVIEVAHEALIRGWPRLRDWIEEDRADLRVHRRLTEAASEWQRLGRDEGALYRGARLAEAIEWRQTNEGWLNAGEHQFLAASEAAERDELEEARRRARRLRLLVVGLVVLLAAAIGAAAYAIHQTGEANAQRDNADAQAKVASSRALASAAFSYSGDAPELAMLLSLEAYRLVADRPVGERFEARNSMLTTLQRNARLTAVLDTHASAVALSPDGGRVASFSPGDREVELWDLGRGASGGLRIRHGARIRAAVFSPDGKTLATAGSGGRIRLWDAADARRIAELDANLKEISRLAFSPDGKMLASADQDGTVSLVGVAGGTRQRLEHSTCYGVVAIAFSADGRTVATGGSHGSIRRWSVAGGKPIGGTLQADPRCPGPNEDILPGSEASSLAFSADGRYLTVADGVSGELSVLDLVESRSVGDAFWLDGEFDVEFYDVLTLALSADAGTVAAARLGANGVAEIRIFDVKTRAARGVVFRHGDAVSSLALSSDAETLVSASQNGKVRVWDVSPRAPLGKPLGQRNPVTSIAFSPDGATLVAVEEPHSDTESHPAISLWNPTSGQALLKLPAFETAAPEDVQVPDAAAHVGFGRRDDVRVLYADGQTSVLWDAAPGARTGRRVSLGRGWLSAALSPDGSAIARSRADGSVHLWDVDRRADRGEPVSDKRHDALYLVFSPDGGELASIGVEAGAEIDPFDATELPLDVRLWKVTSDGLVPGPPLRPDYELTSSLTFSADGSTIATGGPGIIELWDVDSGRSRGKLHGDTRLSVANLAFSPDGATLASAADGGSVQLWDVDRRALLGEPLHAHSNDRTVSVAFNPADGTLASAGEDEPLRLWEDTIVSTSFEVWRTRLCRIAGRNLTRDEWRRLIPHRQYPETSTERICPQFP